MITYGQQGVDQLLGKLRARSEADQLLAIATVREIIQDVRLRGDVALAAYALRFEGTDYQSTPLIVSEGEIDAAYDQCSEEQLKALRLAIKNLTDYHSRQLSQGYTLEQGGAKVSLLVRPLKRVGLYAPGGTACYPSSVLMNAIPAKVAGVAEVLLASPAQQGVVNPLLLIAARECGVKAVFRMGGAQAIAAFAYGTRTVPAVDKVTGPGNNYVAIAKREVYGTVGIDAIAGPSEVCIVADGGANAAYVAADMLAQAEHDVAAAAVLLTTSEALAKSVEQQLDAQTKGAPREGIIRQSLTNYGAIVVLDSLEACFAAANRMAPEHLECMTALGEGALDYIENAGGVFIGDYAPEALGDYLAGTNHVLPTMGSARYASPLGVYDFQKHMSVLCYDKGALQQVKGAIEVLAHTEGLYAHARSAAIRFEEEHDA